MSDLGTALELMYQAAYMPLSTLRMTVAETSDEAALWRSLYAQATDHGPDYLTIGSASFHGGIPPLPKEDSSASEHVWRMCIETPDRLRLESGDSVKIRDGDSWWTYHPLLGVYSNEEDPALSEDIGSEALLILDPSPLIKESRFKVLGREMIAGREAIRLRGEGRHGVLTSRLGEDPRLALAAQSLEYAVDVERGLLLREAKLFEDRPVWCREIIEIEFDEDLPRDTFEPIRGESRFSQPFPAAADVMLEEAASLASFPIFRLDLSTEWRCDASYFPGFKEAQQPEAVRLHYWLPDATHSIDVEQTRSTRPADLEIDEFRARPAGPGGSSGQWERVGDEDVPEGPYRVTGAAVTLHREGTNVIIRSMTLGTDEVLKLMRELVPVTH